MGRPRIIDRSSCRQCGCALTGNEIGKPNRLCRKCAHAYFVKWRSDNRARYRELKRAARHTRRARARSGGRMTRNSWPLALAVLGGRCLKCGKDEATLDHVVPLASGGCNHVSNLQPLCHRCNTMKRTRAEDYRRQDAVIRLAFLSSLICL